MHPAYDDNKCKFTPRFPTKILSLNSINNMASLDLHSVKLNNI